jgi:hypothetical protein
MTKWRVRLSGQPAALQELFELLNTHALSVTREADQYFLTGAELDALMDNLTDPDEAQERVATLLGPIYGVINLYFYGFEGPDVVGIAQIGEDGTQNCLSFNVLGPLAPKGMISIGSRTVPSEVRAKEEEDFKKRMEVAKRDPHVQTALRMLGLYGITWDNLYRIYEIIKDDLSGDVWARGWVTRKQIRRFTQTANSRQAIGDAAPHGHQKYQPPRDPISLSDAMLLITVLLREWILSKSS